MAFPSTELINGLRKAAAELRIGAPYAWGNHGTCNCGNLLQAVTGYTKEEILARAHTGTGDWTELAEEYCNTSNTPVSMLVSRLQETGLTPSDIHHIEYLSDKKILKKLPGGFRWLKRNMREDVILYFETFAGLLEEELIRSVRINTKELMQEPLPA